MKRILFAIALSGFCSAPLYCQEAPPEKAKTPQELLEELHKLMKEASEEMESAEKELAKASLPGSKADVVNERIKAVREKLREGKLNEIPEGLREYLRKNPEKAAELSGKSAEELKKVLESDEALDKMVKENPELQKKIAQSEEAFEKIVESQQAAERRIEETLKKQEQASGKAGESADKAIDLAHRLRQKGQGQGDKPENNDSKTTDDPRKRGEQQGNAGKNAEKPYKPGEGEKPRDDEKEVSDNKTDGDAFTAESRKKDIKDAASNDSGSREPAKYKGFSAKFYEEIRKRQEAARKAAGDNK